jgi:hypothetical protein
MNRRPIVLVAALLALMINSAFGEEAELLPEHDLRAALDLSFGIQIQEWEGLEGEKATLLNTGLGLEYGVKDWVMAQALWIPGVNLWSKMDEGWTHGYFSDMFRGGKVGIMGENALVKRQDMRLSAAMGIKAPFLSRDGSRWEGDKHLWGSVLRVYYDYIFTDLFYLNMYVEGVYYPEQMARTPNYSRGSVFHPLEISLELDSRFRYALEGPGMELHWGLPLRYGVAPWINLRGTAGEQEMMHRFSVGVFFTAAFVKMAYPFDITVRYEAPVAGKNDRPVHRVSLAGRVNFMLAPR